MTAERLVLRAVRSRVQGRPSLLPWIVPALLLASWQLVGSLGIFEHYQLPPPLDVLDAAVALWNRGQLQTHVLATLGRVAGGFALGALAALALGTVVGLSPTVDRLVDPTLQAVRTVPTLAWAPLLLLWMGIDEPPKITLVAIGAFFPVYLNLVAGVHNVDRKLIEVGRVYALSPAGIARRIILPASLPHLITGLRLGLSQSWLFVVVAELIAGTRGLGFLLTDSQNLSRVDLMVVAMLSLAILGKLTDSVLKVIEERLLAWRDTFTTERNAP